MPLLLMAGRVNTLEGTLHSWRFYLNPYCFYVCITLDENKNEEISYIDSREGIGHSSTTKQIKYEFENNSSDFVAMGEDLEKAKDKRIRVRHLGSNSIVFLDGLGKIEIIEK